MNVQRILRITNCYFLLIGYQIRWYDRKSVHYRFTICGVLYFLILSVLYLMCFGHHFEKSSMLKMILDISPFLRNVVRLHVLVGLKVFIFSIIEWKSVTKISNGLVDIFSEHFERDKSFCRYEIIAYVMFFSTLVVASAFGLYIAIELKFELPPLDNIMIATALGLPHLTIAGCLRFYTLGLWLLKRELDYLKMDLNVIPKDSKVLSSQIVIEIINPALNRNLSADSESVEVLNQTLHRLELIADYLKTFDSSLQKQLPLLMSLNFNCLLFGAYSQVYFENIWHVIFTDRNRRIFYAANSAIFVCILMDYVILLLTHYNFDKTKRSLSELVFLKSPLEELQAILKNIKLVLEKNFNSKLFGLVEFNAWNFLMFQGLMLSIIAIIVTYQYLNDQIVAVSSRLDNYDSNSD